VRFERASNEEKWNIREETFNVHRQLEAVMDKDDTLSKQIILRSKYLLGSENGPYGYEEGMTMLLDAIRLTSPRFDLAKIDLGLYTENEIKLINNMAQCCLRTERHYEAIDILRSLLYYLQTHWKKIPPNRAYIPMVAFNYARELEIVKQYDEAAGIAEYARKNCVDYGHYSVLPALLHILAECHYHRGDCVKSEEFYRQAYYLYKVIEDERNRVILQIEAKNYLGLVLE
jgi:tetratricopeptide (TPR) repeat protein